MSKEHQPQKVAISHIFAATKSTNGMYEAVCFHIRPSDGNPIQLTMPARDLPDFERVVRQATTAHKQAVREEKEARIRAAQHDIEKLAIALSAPARTRGEGWYSLSEGTRAEYTKQAEDLYGAGWRQDGERLT